MEQKLWDTFATAPLDFLMRSVKSVSSMVKNVCKLLGPMLQSDAKQQCTGFKMLQD
jgi:hypothetical protein